MYQQEIVEYIGPTFIEDSILFLCLFNRFVLRIPDSLPLEAAAPLLVAGITVYSPMKHFGLTEKGKHLGVVGLGGVGHLAVIFGKAFDLKVTVISSSPRKENEAKHLLGADNFLISSDEDAMKVHFKPFPLD